MSEPLILHVEDDDAAALLVRVALRETCPEVRCHRVSSVDEALKFLSTTAVHRGVPPPRVILLDLNLPRKNGFDMLKILRESARLAHLPVVVFSSSAAPSDRKMALSLGATEYIGKPSSYEGYVSALRYILKVDQPRKAG